DLGLRGPGTLYGTEQSGRFADLKIATLADSGLLERTREAAKKLLSEDPHLARHPLLAAQLERQSQKMHFE
ncbi:MAG: hypothetical protein HYW81_02375, partial [Parcubacteria group bacterium]|nr:hypothetical protein [Parcubacteria group bacterium]